jgi:hypothetical protein
MSVEPLLGSKEGIHAHAIEGLGYTCSCMVCMTEERDRLDPRPSSSSRTKSWSVKGQEQASPLALQGKEGVGE